jgi:hypothetical protein
MESASTLVAPIDASARSATSGSFTSEVGPLATRMPSAPRSRAVIALCRSDA